MRGLGREKPRQTGRQPWSGVAPASFHPVDEAPERLDERAVWQAARREVEATADAGLPASSLGAAQEFGDEPGLADAGLARDEDE